MRMRSRSLDSSRLRLRSLADSPCRLRRGPQLGPRLFPLRLPPSSDSVTQETEFRTRREIKQTNQVVLLASTKMNTVGKLLGRLLIKEERVKTDSPVEKGSSCRFPYDYRLRALNKTSP
ncbi:unnamed protein product [Nezara viridula]|uniref:Uncharacterized protein n=1 Tax=Nezara viridula TaxID=85310 RepID=A0A9P0H1L1_NEZVI|nr:unnamed protein product [Nezara viridula]